MVESDTVGNKQNETQAEDDVRRKEKMEREEYMEKLKKWLDDARLWHYNICAGLPIHSVDNIISDNTIQQVPNVYANFTYLNLWNQNAQNHFPQRFFEGVFNGPENRNPNIFHTGTHIFQHNRPPSTYEFVIPPLWKRAIAELMDFLLLFLFKMALTFVLLESFDIIGIGFYGFELFQRNLENPEVAMPMAMELLTLELLHRIVVCAYEVDSLGNAHTVRVDGGHRGASKYPISYGSIVLYNQDTGHIFYKDDSLLHQERGIWD